MSNTSSRSILFIAPFPFFQWRGSPIRVRHDLEALSDLGYRIDLLTVPLGEPIEIPRVTIHRVENPLGICRMPIGPSWHKIVFDVLLFKRALEITRRRRFDVFHCVEDAGAIGLLVRKIRDGQLVFEKHSNRSSYVGGGPFRRLILRAYRGIESLVMRDADLVLAGPNVIGEVGERTPTTSTQLVTSIPSSRVEPDAERASEIRAGLGGDGRVLLTYIGSFASYQGIDLLFEAIARVGPDHPEVRFVIIGGSVDEIRQWRAWLAQRGVEEAVVFVGKVHPDDTPHHLAASDILLSPRTGGPNPTKIFDYLKVGRAIVATDLPTNGRILDDTTSVLTPATPEGFADGIRSLLVDPARRRALGARGSRLIEERYSFGIFREAMAEGYRRLNQRGPSRNDRTA